MKNEITERYARIAKECFWEYRFSAEEIEKLFASNNRREKQFLFEKILLNSSELFGDMALFDTRDLAAMLEVYVVPKFNEAYTYRRKNSVEYYLLNKPLVIDELKWVA